MKNTNLIILLSLVFAGVYGQQERHVISIEETNQIQNEINELYEQAEAQISQTEYTRETSIEPQLSPQVLVSYSYTLQYPIAEYESMILRCKELTTKLVEHDKLVQTGKMTKAQINEWKRDVIEAKLLNYRIDDYTAMYTRENYPLIEYVNKDVLNNYDDFSKILDSATQYAGF